MKPAARLRTPRSAGSPPEASAVRSGTTCGFVRRPASTVRPHPNDRLFIDGLLDPALSGKRSARPNLLVRPGA